MKMEKLEIEDFITPSLKQKCISVFNKHKFTLTVEPLVFLASLAFGLNEVLNFKPYTKNRTRVSHFLQVIRSTLITQKICQNKLNFSEEDCGNLTQLENLQQEVQREVTDYEALYNAASILPRLHYCRDT